MPARAEIAFGSFGPVGDPDIVRVFADDAQGDVPPLRTLGGPATLLAGAADLVYDTNGLEHDARTDQFLVFTNVFAPAGPQALLFFPRTALGEVAPSRKLGGPSTGVGESYGPLAASLDLTFFDGFEATGP